MKLNKILTVVFLLIASIVNAATFYVNASAIGLNNGTSWENAYTNLQTAISSSAAGSVLSVTNGTYSPISTANKSITVESVNGPLFTFINSGLVASSSPAILGSSSTHKSTVLTGFTIKGGRTYGVRYGTLNRCVIRDNYTTSYVVQNSTLNNCLVTANITESITCFTPILNNCTIIKNHSTSSSSSHTGGTSAGTIKNSIIWGNSSALLLTNNYITGTMTYTTTTPARTGTGNLSTDPKLVNVNDSEGRLRDGSPCLNSGLNSAAVGTLDLDGNPRISDTTIDRGSYEGSISGWVITGGVIGNGSLTKLTTIVNDGDNAEFFAVVSNRPFSNFSTNGIFASNSTNLIWNNITSDGTIMATFSSLDLFVDANKLDDSSDGFNWSTAKRSIQSAIDSSYDGESIFVTNGVYGPIVSNNKSINISSINGY